jgi:FkbM family methyltransferase
MVIDVGANIGLYTLFAAKVGRDVLCVEPFEDNVLKLHKSVKLQNFETQITLINNVVTNKRNETKNLYPQKKNYGNQMIDKTYNKNNSVSDDKNYLINSIVLDDLVNYLPINKRTNQVYEKAIMKIDIESFEPVAFQSASVLLDAIDIRIIFMEWAHGIEDINK